MAKLTKALQTALVAAGWENARVVPDEVWRNGAVVGVRLRLEARGPASVPFASLMTTGPEGQEPKSLDERIAVIREVAVSAATAAL